MSLFPPTPKLGMVTRLLLTCFFLLLFPYSSFADFSGQVVSVLDGVLSKSSRKKGRVWMLKVGWNHRDPITITGQVGRILGALIFSRIRGAIGEYW